MTAIKSFTEIKAWQAARKLTTQIYLECSKSPIANDWGMRNQLTRAAVSVMSNIAEGFGRGSDKEFAWYLDIARGSVAEVQSLLYTCEDVDYLEELELKKLMELAMDTASLIGGFKRYLKA